MSPWVPVLVGVTLTTISGLLGVIWYFAVLRWGNTEESLKAIHGKLDKLEDKYVTKDVFDRESRYQNRILNILHTRVTGRPPAFSDPGETD